MQTPITIASTATVEIACERFRGYDYAGKRSRELALPVLGWRPVAVRHEEHVHHASHRGCPAANLCGSSRTRLTQHDPVDHPLGPSLRRLRRLTPRPNLRHL